MYLSALFLICKNVVINLWLWEKNSSIKFFHIYQFKYVTYVLRINFKGQFHFIFYSLSW